MTVISLLTDFGHTDAYVGIMKGVILATAPAARIVDLSHEIAPGGLVQAAHCLYTSYGYFPENTVHTVVVDPGVGSSRAIVAVATADHIFLAPDNGVLSRVLENTSVSAAVRVENPQFFHEPVSRTFHGRDIFAPVAAHLAMGAEFHQLGPSIDPGTLVRLHLAPPVTTATGEVIGTIIDIDRFGNLITDIGEDLITGSKHASAPTVQIGNHTLSGLSDAYAAVASGKPLAIIGSRGTLELSVNCGDARRFFSAAIGEPVRVNTSIHTSGEAGLEKGGI